MNNEQLFQEYQSLEQKLSRLGAAVAVYGGARLPADSPEYALAERLARRFAEAGLAVLSGGGPGIMEAANKGAAAGGGVSVGLNIFLPYEQRPNSYQNLSLHFQHFAPRKAAFARYARAFVVLPGGFGTLDELFETLTLVKTGKIPPAPVILVDSEFWRGLTDWLDMLAARGLLENDKLMLTDNEDEIFDTVMAAVR